MPAHVDFAAAFARLQAENRTEDTTAIGGVNVRLVRVPANGPGRWDSHATTPETVVVWSGQFQVEYRDGTVLLGPGGCCVVPAGAEHRGTSPTGAEVVLFQNAP